MAQTTPSPGGPCIQGTACSIDTIYSSTIVEVKGVGATKAAASGLPAGDCQTDDAPALNRIFASRTGVTFRLAPGCYRILSDDLKLAPGNTYVGAGNALLWLQKFPANTEAATFAVDPARAVVAPGPAVIDNLAAVADYIMQHRNPTDAELAAQVATWGASLSVGLYLPSPVPSGIFGGGQNKGQTVRNVFLGGFGRGFVSRSGVGTYSDIWIDSYNGFLLYDVGAPLRTYRVYPNRWLCLSSTNCTQAAESGSTYRPGIGLMLDNVGSTIYDSYAAGFATLVLMNNGNSRFYETGGECFGNWPTSSPQYTIGMRSFGTSASTFNERHFLRCSINMLVESSGPSNNPAPTQFNSIDITRVDLGNNPTAYVATGGDTTPRQIVTLNAAAGGQPSVGDTLTIVLKNQEKFPGPTYQKTFTYAVSGVDVHYSNTATRSRGYIADGMALVMNTDQAMMKAHCHAESRVSQAITIFCPVTDTSFEVSSATYSGTTISTAISTDTSDETGASVIFRSPLVRDSAASVPLFKQLWGSPYNLVVQGLLVGPSGLWSSWASGYDQTMKVTFPQILLQKTPTRSPNQCQLADGATSFVGTMTTNTTPSACTLTYEAPMPWAPKCTVVDAATGTFYPTSPVGSAGAYTGFTWSFTSGSNRTFDYRCNL